MRDKDKDGFWRFKRISFKDNGVKLLAYYGYISEDRYKLQFHSPYKISNTVYRTLPPKDTYVNMRNIVKENIVEYYNYAETVNYLSNLKTPSEIKEFADKCFREVVAVIGYVWDNRKYCQELLDRTCQFWNALLDLQLDGKSRTGGYEDFINFVRQRYFEIECDKYITDNEEVKRIVLERGLWLLMNLINQLRKIKNGEEC